MSSYIPSSTPAAATADQWSEHYRRMSEGSMAGNTVYVVKTGQVGGEKTEEPMAYMSLGDAALEQAKDAAVEWRTGPPGSRGKKTEEPIAYMSMADTTPHHKQKRRLLSGEPDNRDLEVRGPMSL